MKVLAGNMQVYAIRNDGTKYQYLDLFMLDILRHSPDDMDIDEVLDFNSRNTTMSGWWQTPETDFLSVEGGESALLPDICLWIDASLVLSPKAYRLLGELLALSGELLPVMVRGATYYLFNCFVMGEEDSENTRFEICEGLPAGLECLAFKKSTAALLVFKSQLQSCLTLFCGDDFRSIVESFALSGIVFDLNLIENFYSD